VGNAGAEGGKAGGVESPRRTSDDSKATAAPRVSVLLPARDAEATVEVAVRSILEQTLSDLEVIAVDDGSSDATGAVLARLAAEDERVRVLTTPGLGLVGALNLGLTACHAPLIARMDADDESLPRRLEVSVAALDANPALAGVGTGVDIFRDDRPPSPNLQAYGRWLSSLTSPELLFRDRLVESPLCHPSVTLRRAALDAVAGWRDGDFPEDWDLWLRLLEAGHRLTAVSEVLHRWRDHDRRLTRQDARYALERHLDLKADVLARRFAGVPLTLWGATETGRGLARRLLARGARVERFVELSPRKVGQRIHGAPVVRPEALGPPPEGHLLACVAAKGARDDIREWLAARGWLEVRDFTCVA
jgi:glycosyltransferase involved in cell wall biosynthesis